jgi:DNA-binding CsgD family transcriptional regulator
MMHQLEIEKETMRKNIRANTERLLLPLIARLKTEHVSSVATIAGLLEQELLDLTSSFGASLSESIPNLTRKEIEICNFIKNGLSTKEIAGMLNISEQTIKTHRKNIRRKLRIHGKQTNLESLLAGIVA